MLRYTLVAYIDDGDAG